MSVALAPVDSVAEAWVLGLEELLESPRGRVVHLISTIEDPTRDLPEVRAVLDDFCASRSLQSMETVSETIFPASLYTPPGVAWNPDLPDEDVGRLDDAATTLYAAYGDMLPILLTADGNSRGTYFSRMVTWPGKVAGGTNQLAARIEALRREHRRGRATFNLSDIDVAADASEDLAGVQLYRATDNRLRGFPCLTHIDLTLFEGTLHATALYRHQYYVAKAYGNFLGLGRLMQFLCDQTGFACGELVVHATFADDERHDHARCRVQELAGAARLALDGSFRDASR